MIEWESGAVCFAKGKQWLFYGGESEFLLSNKELDHTTSLGWVLAGDDFQLNTLQIGDYIEKSELDTEQKYNGVVEVFGLFGFPLAGIYETLKFGCYDSMVISLHGNAVASKLENSIAAKRKLTYNQIMAIGKLRRMMNEKSAVKSAPKATAEVSVDKKHKPIVAQVMIDLTERMEIGIKEYGKALRPHNGRDALQDAYEEALDLACYLKQAIIERDLK